MIDRETEEQDLAGEDRFRGLVENAPDMIYRFRVDPPGYEYVNPAALGLTGYPPESFYADPELMYQLTVPEDRERLREAWHRPLPAGAALQVQLVRSGGGQVWTEHRIVPVHAPDGQLIAVEGIARDISARKRAEEEVRLFQEAAVAISQSRDLHSALQVVLQAVCHVTGWAFGQAWLPAEDGQRLLCGPCWSSQPDRVKPFRQRCLHFSPAPGTGLLGLAWQSGRPLWSPDVSEEVDFPRAQIAREVGFKAAMAIPVLGGDQVVAIAEFYLFERREEDERLVGVVSAVAAQLGGAILRRRMEEELQVAVASREHMMTELERQNRQLQALIQHMAEGVVAVDAAARALLVNPAATSLLGLPGPFGHQPLDQLGFPGDLVAAITAAARSASPGLDEVRFTCGGAEIRALISPMIGEGHAGYGAVALLQDVTMENQLRRLRENFVANVSHELRGPLAALSAGVEAMHDGLIRPDAQPRYFKAMLSEIGRLRRLTNDLLELSRLDAGTIRIPVEEFDLAPLADGLGEKWGPRAATTGITLVIDCPHVRIMGNIDRVEEVLTNFLDNAFRYTPAGGSIRLFARSEGEMVRVGVVDTGIGIPREHLPHIWERFYKTDPARTRTLEGGTGLGLSICKQFVELMGGEVAVRSELGAGSCFSFTLVAARSQAD